MAYLPPAGIRIITSNKKTDLVFGREVPNTFYYTDRRKVPCSNNKKRKFQELYHKLPPTSVKDEDWVFPQHENIYGTKPCPLDSQCPIADPVCFSPDDYSLYDTRARNPEAYKQMNRDTYDVKIRYDDQSRWQNQAMKYFAIYRQWEALYGKKYFYKCTC